MEQQLTKNCKKSLGSDLKKSSKSNKTPKPPQLTSVTPVKVFVRIWHHTQIF